MNASTWYRSSLFLFVALSLLSLLTAGNAEAATQLLLARGDSDQHAGEIKGIVDLTVDPGFEDAKVSVSVDGQKVATGIGAPYRVIVDFGQAAVQHKITISATAGGKRVQWHETINQGLLPLTVKVKPVDKASRLFEAVTTAHKDDPIAIVEAWDNGRVVATATEAPYRFIIPESAFQSGFVQVTAKTKAGEEAADFWSAAGDVHVAEIAVRTVPIFVSVVDRNGQTQDQVDRTKFRIVDNNEEGKIIEFGKAFDQPISIALLLDASSSMSYSMKHASKAAHEFVQRALRPGDRCTIIAVQDVPRPRQPLTGDLPAIAKALDGIEPTGQTALYDAVAFALRELQNEKRRRAVVVLTDGSDTASIMTAKDLDKVTRQAGIPIYFIAYEGGEEQSPRDLDRLKYFADQTGGFVAVATQQNLATKYAAIEKDLRAQFAILYQVTDYSKTNEYRRVRVVLDGNLEARTIKGYFTP